MSSGIRARPIYARRGATLVAAVIATLVLLGPPVCSDALAQVPGAFKNWPRTAFPDGSGSIALPPRWTLSSAQRASAEVSGPLGEAIATGVSLPMVPAQFAQPGMLASAYLQPPEAFAFVMQVTGHRIGTGARVTRIVSANPIAPLTQGGNAAVLYAELVVRNRPYRAFALVNTAPLQGGYWQYYMTLLMAPVEAFEYSLPIMVDIWQSWGISQGEMNRRFAQALATVRETDQIMRGASEAMRAPERHNEMTRDVLGGEWVVEDRNSGKREKIDMREANLRFEREPGRWRMLSASERK